MTRARLFSPDRLAAHSKLKLVGDQARYVGKVLRLRPDDDLILFDGHGGELLSPQQDQRQRAIAAELPEFRT